LKIPAPKGRNLTLTENAASPFHAEPRQELAALNHYFDGDRTYFLLPLRALVNDKYDDFTRKYADFGLRIIRSTGEISDDNDALMRSKFDVAILTYERFAALAVALPHILRQVGLVVIDESLCRPSA
jgi:helicase